MDTSVHGGVSTGFEGVREAFEEIYSRGWDYGSSFALFSKGRLVVELYGGVRNKDAIPSHIYDERTLQFVASSTKFVESVCIALLVDRGKLAYGDRIVKYWPEFAAGDPLKSEVTVRQLMMHRAGLPVFDAKLTDAELLSPEALSKFLERQKIVPELFRAEAARWSAESPPPPQAYHAVSRGLYTSQLCRRVDGRSLAQFLREEIAAPLGLDIFIGLPAPERERLAAYHGDAAGFQLALAPGDDSSADPRYRFYPHEREFLRQLLTDPSSIPHRALMCLATPERAPDYELPSSNGYCSAKALASIAALVAEGGELNGKKIFSSDKALREATRVADRYACDGVMGTPITFSQGGFARLYAEDTHRTATFGWGGAGGSMVRFVPEMELACAYVTNTGGVRMAMHDPRANRLLAAAIGAARG